MKFFRERITHREDNGFTPNGTPVTKVIVDQTARADIILGDGTTEFDTYSPSNPTVPVPIQTVELTDAYDDNRYTVNLSGNGQIYVVAKVIDFGATITSLDVLIEFMDPDHAFDASIKMWLPSKEGVDRDDDEAAHTWTLTATGFFILASRKEPSHFKKARVSFRADADAADSDTRIHLSWFHDGGVAMVPEQ